MQVRFLNDSRVNGRRFRKGETGDIPAGMAEVMASQGTVEARGINPDPGIGRSSRGQAVATRALGRDGRPLPYTPPRD